MDYVSEQWIARVKSLRWAALYYFILILFYIFLRYDLATAYVNADGLFKMYLESANPPFHFLRRCLLSSHVQMEVEA